MTKTFNRADVCEFAHEATQEICRRLEIELDKPIDDSIDMLDAEVADDMESQYTDEAQAVFDTIADHFEEELERLGFIYE